MRVPDVTDVNEAGMKAERLPCLTEHLISLFWVFSRKAERAAGENVSAVVSEAIMMIILLTFICLGLINTRARVHRCPVRMNRPRAQIPLWVADQLFV